MLEGADVRQHRTPLSRSPNDSGTRRQKALLIGVRKVDKGSENHPELKSAHGDVNAMRMLLIDIYHYTPADITVLLDDEIDGHIQPTRDNILDAIKDLVKGVKADDRLFFHYSGHSAQVPNWRSNSEEDGMDECLVPLDGEEVMIVDNELHAHLVEPLPVGAHLVAVLDTSHSGILLGQHAPFPIRRNNLADLTHYRCNRVFVPWIFRGRRNSEDKWQDVVRRDALLSRISPFSNRNQTLPSVNVLSKDIRQVQGPGEPLSPLPSVRRRTVFPRLSAFSKLRPRMTLRPLDTSAAALAWILPEDDQRCDSPVEGVCSGWCRDHRPQDAGADGVKADVISLASCQGSQFAWESKTPDGMQTMTSALVDFLRADSNRSLEDVLMSVSHATHSMALQRHRQGRVNERQRKEFEKSLEERAAQLYRNASSTSLTLPESAPVPARLARAQTFPAPRRKDAALTRHAMHPIKRMQLLLKKARQHGGYGMDYFQNPQLASPQPLDMNRQWRM
ncbi:caspase domain-containing protein [Mycena vulgaris]|nr:caspase domain-containing protein [Mycena vulgaris]